MRELLLILITLIFIGCSKNEEQPVEQCPNTGGLSIGLRVKVYDKLSGEFIEEGIEVKAIDGNYSERLILARKAIQMKKVILVSLATDQEYTELMFRDRII